MRGLLWRWEDSAIQQVVDSLTDETWRVREMAAKVVARHQVDETLNALLLLREDTVARVRKAAVRGIRKLTADND
jgi:HEAT repeat protein